MIKSAEIQRPYLLGHGGRLYDFMEKSPFFYHLNINPFFPSFFLYVRCKLGVTIVGICFPDVLVAEIQKSLDIPLIWLAFVVPMTKGNWYGL